MDAERWDDQLRLERSERQVLIYERPTCGLAGWSRARELGAQRRISLKSLSG